MKKQIANKIFIQSQIQKVTPSETFPNASTTFDQQSHNRSKSFNNNTAANNSKR